MIKTAYIIPTGNEIKNGTVLDLDSLIIIKKIIAEYPQAVVIRECPIEDSESSISLTIKNILDKRPDIIVLIGGSGEGHKYSKVLGKDCTHSAIESCMDTVAVQKIYGKNGHMWTKLVCGKKGNTLVVNVPGPFVEAKAAIYAIIESVNNGLSLEDICRSSADAVYNQYPKGKTNRPQNNNE